MSNKSEHGEVIAPLGQLLEAEEAAALLAAIVASSNDAILSKTLDGTITSWNAATTSLFGYSPEEMIGRSIRVLIPEDRQSEEDHILAQIAAGRRIENYETVRLRKDGTPIEVSVTVSPVRDSAGKVVGASKIVRDITERRESERRIDALLREVNHRAKNLLGLVQAIAFHTRAADIDDFRERFSARLQALATNQDLLVSSNWQHVSLGDLVAAELAAFPDPLKERVSTEGPSVDLAAPAAQALSMALHELATNAIKYGALSTGSGTVSIVWQTEAEEFSIAWIETGGPPVSAPDHAGFGTRVISRLIESQIGGRVALTFPHEGVQWRFRAAMARLTRES